MNVSLSDVTIGVIGSGTDAHDGLAHGVGTLLAELGVNLLTGGGGGVMRAVSRAFTEAPRERGICIGIIPCLSERERAEPKHGYPNEFVELSINTHLPHTGLRGRDDLSRNHINVLSCAALVALPGESGTASEVSLAVDYQRPVIAYASDPAQVEHFAASVQRVTSLDQVRTFLCRYIG
jgi:uncharacterized protein (TIGR00725 family)